MATINSDRISGITASADCSAKQYCFAAVSGDRTATFAGTAGIACLGVIANKPVSGAPMEILVGPVVKITLSGTISAGAHISTTNAGLAKSAATGEKILGQLLVGGAVNEVREMYFNPGPIAP
jgi:hypothetical protein